MKLCYPDNGLARLCGLFGKTRQAFYDHLWRQSDDRLQEAIIIDLVKIVRKTLPKAGAQKVRMMLQQDLRQHGITIGRDSFFALLRHNELLVKTKKKYVRTTDSNHHFKKWPNLIEAIQPDAPEELWVSDITYLRTQNRFVYLSLVTDAYSRKIVGYHLSQYLKAQGCIIALDKAIASLQKPLQNLIHHSDRGIQYCCDLYISRLQAMSIQISMTQSGSPYDNAIAERVNGILKIELGLEDTFKDYGHAVAATHQAINSYNTIRPHLSCDNLTPEQAHKKQGLLNKQWKPKNKKWTLNH
jgi:transposase InsO family protein